MYTPGAVALDLVTARPGARLLVVPSGRGELEITDVNNAYIREGTMSFSYLDGWWTDAGTFDSLLRATNLVAQSEAKKQLASAAISAVVSEGVARV